MESSHLLLIADDPGEAARIAHELARFEPPFAIERVVSAETLETAITALRPAAVLCDSRLVALSALDALTLTRRLDPDLPFLLLCGEREEAAAVESMRHGADDYVFHEHPSRLEPALRRTLRAAQARSAQTAEFSRLTTLEERWRALLENSSDLVAILDTSGVITYASPSHQRLLGYDAEEFVGRDAFSFIHPEDRREAMVTFESLVREAPDSRRAEYRILRKDGTWRWVDSIGRNLLQQPAIAGLLVTSRDITERRLLQDQLAHSQRLTSIGRLAATIAHEFNNVLMGIQPFADVIRRQGGASDKIVSAAGMIAASVERGRSITQDLLRFTQSPAPVLGPVPLLPWLTRLESDLAGMLGSRHHLEVAVRDETTLFADPAQMSQVVTNIVLNARDAMPTGGTITLRVSTMHGARVMPFGVIPDTRPYVHLEIEDSGCGIEKEALGHIFDPLYTTKKNGTGLGLTVAHQIVRKHDGHLFVESTHGSGTAFHIFIPAAESPAATTPASAPLALPERHERFDLLLVEDEPAVAEGIAAVLKLADHRVTVARTGRAAIAALGLHQFDAVILDVTLPDMVGTDVFHEIRALQPHLPVVFSTAHYDPTALESILGTSEHVAYLMKPYDVDALLDELRRVVPREA